MDKQAPAAFSPPRLYRLSSAVQQFFPQGGITVRSLRTEAKAGRLKLIRIANKDFVTAEAIQEMLEHCTCRVNESHPVSISGSGKAENPSGSSLMERERQAQAALQQILQAPKKR